jgi:hypothetical protein
MCAVAKVVKNGKVNEKKERKKVLIKRKYKHYTNNNYKNNITHRNNKHLYIKLLVWDI